MTLLLWSCHTRKGLLFWTFKQTQNIKFYLKNVKLIFGKWTFKELSKL